MDDDRTGQRQHPAQPDTETDVPAGAVALERVGSTTRPVVTSHGVVLKVFIPAAAIVLAFVLVAVAFPRWLGSLMAAANTVVVSSLGWYYVLIVTGFVLFALYLAFSRLGDIKLGRDEEKPQYGMFTWFAMLFAAGMGIGLVFWGVAEPLNHFASPPPRAVGGPETLAQGAMTYTFLHWGLHAWAIYIVVGLSMAYVVHRRRRPVSLRWALEPLLGTERVQGGWGHVVDVVAVVGTMFGVATSLGFGVVQIGAGLDHLGVLQLTRTALVVLIIVIAGMAALSVATGLDAGIKWLSNINLVFAGLFLLAVLLAGPTLFLLREFVQSVGSYLESIVRLSFATLPYQGAAGEAWLASWTTYYWGWWMSWSPFVGIFIARISRGRTVREFIVGVLLAPTLVTFLWFSIMGGTALYRELFGDGGLITDGKVDNNTALFQMLEALPGGPVLSGLAILLVVIFFVTSSDSGSYVVSMLSTGGDPNPPLWTRLTWAVLSGAIAAVLLGTGGAGGALASLQTMAILVAAPFSIVMIAMCVALYRSLGADHATSEQIRRALVRERLVTAVVGELGGPDTPPNRPIERSAAADRLRSRLLRRRGHDG
ncbi:BCCT family transporter [Georgenia sp. SYP-B2076]|uniref:BCCT family transporter n=1 Tax=Georgenia sp. SYP-B2076 TaxID=2495881 RepID=UPI000F8EB1D8|nr:BCCT family transporter [Georgenia sp. SYP-B2076]